MSFSHTQKHSEDIWEIKCKFYFSSKYKNFLVLVITCGPIKWPANGHVYCNDTEHIYGSNCTAECAEGYEMDSLSSSEPYQIMCNKSSSNQGEWHKEVPQCKGWEHLD